MSDTSAIAGHTSSTSTVDLRQIGAAYGVETERDGAMALLIWKPEEQPRPSVVILMSPKQATFLANALQSAARRKKRTAK